MVEETSQNILLMSFKLFNFFSQVAHLHNLIFSLFQACFLPLSDASSFAVLYLVTSVYFSGVMVNEMITPFKLRKQNYCDP